MSRDVVVLDYGSGNVRSAVRMLERVGAQVELTSERARVLAADGLFVPGVGNFHACLAGLRAVDGAALIRRRLSEQAPVLGVCVGMQALFAGSAEPSLATPEPGVGIWRQQVERLRAPVVPHMGWSSIEPPAESPLLAALSGERFYFVHSYAVHQAATAEGSTPLSTWSEHGERFVAAVEDEALTATQFHPEKSGDAGAALLSAWVRSW